VELSDRVLNKLNIILSCIFFPRTFDTVAAQMTSFYLITPNKILILILLVLKAAKYEIDEPSTCRAILFRCKFWVDVSRFSPCVINLSRN